MLKPGVLPLAQNTSKLKRQASNIIQVAASGEMWLCTRKTLLDKNTRHAKTTTHQNKLLT